MVSFFHTWVSEAFHGMPGRAIYPLDAVMMGMVSCLQLEEGWYTLVDGSLGN